MCGIIAYLGKGNTENIILSGLRNLEYRGYDSAGIAVLEQTENLVKTRVLKSAGKLDNLEKILPALQGNFMQGMGHTRWATHGEANTKNAHPHCSGPITIVHNGIIENYQELKVGLVAEGYTFLSDTDSEVFAHLVHRERRNGTTLRESVYNSFKRVSGGSAFVVMDESEPGTFVAIRRGSPLLLAKSESGIFVSSDAPAISSQISEVEYLKENEFAEITEKRLTIFNSSSQERDQTWKKSRVSASEVSKGEFSHFMLKEIYEQPKCLEATLKGWMHGGRLYPDENAYTSNKIPSESLIHLFSDASQIFFVACGSAAHAAQYGQNIMESVAKISSKFELASEFRYRNPVLRDSDIGIVISQSGETADTLAATKLMKESGMKVFAICNVPESSLVRECDGTFHTFAGPEIGVASTKAFTSQLACLAALTVYLASEKGFISQIELHAWMRGFDLLPQKVAECIAQAKHIKMLARKHIGKKTFLFLGRNQFYSIALEGALKLKETSYLSAEGYAAGELKHGPIARVDENTLCLVIAPDLDGICYEKTISNMEEVLARRGTVIPIISADDASLNHMSPIFVPEIGPRELLAILSTISIQLFSFYSAFQLGCDIDKPRNLAKSVTVE